MELLIVMAIMAIILAVGIPAFNQFGKGAAMNSALSNLRSTIAFAKQWAITKRQRTYIVFPDDATALYSNGREREVEKAFKSYSVYTAEEGYLQPWNYLPEGIVFNPDTNKTKNLFQRQDSLESVNFPDDTSSTNQLFCLVFTSNGRLEGAGIDRISVYLEEGVINVDTNTGTVVTYFFKSSGAKYEMQMKGLTSQLRIFDLTQ